MGFKKPNVTESAVKKNIVDAVLEHESEAAKAEVAEKVESTELQEQTFHVKGNAYIAGAGRWQVVEEDVKATTSQMAIAKVGCNYAAFKPIEWTAK